MLKEEYKNNDFSELNQNLNNLCYQLKEFDNYLNLSGYCFNHKIFNGSLINIANIYVAINGTYSSFVCKEWYHIGFGTDKMLTENEYKFIVSISDDLKTLVEPIYDLKRRDVRKNSKMKDFIKSLDILDNWSKNSERTLSGTSPFDYLQIN